MPSAGNPPATAARPRWFFPALSRIQQDAGWPRTNPVTLQAHAAVDSVFMELTIFYRRVSGSCSAPCGGMAPSVSKSTRMVSQYPVWLSGLGDNRVPQSIDTGSGRHSGTRLREVAAFACAFTASGLTLIVRVMSEERDNALAIAELRGDLAAVRAEMQAMESRIESRIDAGMARLAEEAAKRDADAAKREIRLIVTMVGLILGAVTILGFLIRLD